jgi:hypothetical protein
MNNKAIYSALKSQLENAVGLSYVKQVLGGNRDLNTITLFPTILINYTGEQESQEVYNRFENKIFFTITGVVNVIDPEKALIGDANTDGIMDFLNDVKTALDSDYTLGGVASHIVIGNSQSTSDLYPLNFFALEIEVWFRQEKGNRT